ncbi:methyltransferase [Streptomyces kaniharaensis]|uniref:methyltransferase n=1 Tax=Streptomyces kaniharaensis TaxID=212423 RepID=UPI0018A84B86|nr:methyltransferase [Streptomyces kaniharaensis]
MQNNEIQEEYVSTNVREDAAARPPGAKPADPPGVAPDPADGRVQQMMDLLHGAIITQLLVVAAEFDIAELLAEGPLPVSELARRCGADPQALHRVLRALAAQEVFREAEPGVFTLTPLAETLRVGAPGSVRAWTRFWGLPEKLQAINSLAHSVRTGCPSFTHLYGTDWWSHLAAHPEQAELFNDAMGGLARRIHAAALESCDLTGVTRVVDVGGGHGHLLATILPRYPHMRATLLDQPSVVVGAKAVLDKAGVADRVDLVGGDFFDGVPPGADAYLMSMILHDWDDEQCVAVLGTIRRAMAPNARIMVVESIVPEGNVPHDGKLRDVIMMALHPGRERTEAEYAALFAAAGLRHVATTSLASSTGLLVARA